MNLLCSWIIPHRPRSCQLLTFSFLSMFWVECKYICHGNILCAVHHTLISSEGKLLLSAITANIFVALRKEWANNAWIYISIQHFCRLGFECCFNLCAEYWIWTAWSCLPQDPIGGRRNSVLFAVDHDIFSPTASCWSWRGSLQNFDTKLARWNHWCLVDQRGRHFEYAALWY